jgi:hypothetical protein
MARAEIDGLRSCQFLDAGHNLARRTRTRIWQVRRNRNDRLDALCANGHIYLAKKKTRSYPASKHGFPADVGHMDIGHVLYGHCRNCFGRRLRRPISMGWCDSQSIRTLAFSYFRDGGVRRDSRGACCRHARGYCDCGESAAKTEASAISARLLSNVLIRMCFLGPHRVKFPHTDKTVSQALGKVPNFSSLIRMKMRG